MSRSRHPQCSGGRGCYVCGDAGEVRRDREEDALRADEREDPNPVETMLEEAVMARLDANDGSGDAEEAAIAELIADGDHSDCDQCNGYSDIESFDCEVCHASYMSPENAAECCSPGGQEEQL